MLGKFIVVEGIEGAGKTTAINIIADELAQYAISELEYTREPGGTIIAEEIRTLIKRQHNLEKLTDKAELLLMYAARAQLVETIIKPALEQGKWVIGDRHDLSSQAYQGGGRGIPFSLISQLREIVLGDFQPDLTFYMDISPEMGLQRAKQRGELDRFEMESLEFFTKIRNAYQDLIQDNHKIKVIDASQPLDRVEHDIRYILRSWLKEQGLHLC